HPKRGSTKPDQDTTEQDMTPTNGGGALQPFGDVWLVGKIEPGELADDTAMIRLLIDQLNRPLNDVAEADVLRWFAAAEHARSTPGIGNREGLFQSTIMSPLGSDAWKRITENEEQAAHHRYKRMRGLHVCRRRTDDPVAEVLGDDQ
ncbi:MAG: hypothetical protein MI741_08595, partial [Rhodospirillales bacterium]|nr:hypothetical protein [Rhodospirillales bacterium]